MLQSAIIGGPLPEETAKIIAFVSTYWLFSLYLESDIQLRLMVLHATSAGMGFGIVEGISYVTQLAPLSTQHAWMHAIIRAAMSVPKHAMWAYISGCSYLIAYMDNRCYMVLFLCAIWRSYLIHALSNGLASYIQPLMMKLFGCNEDTPLLSLRAMAALTIAILPFVGLSVWVCRCQFQNLKRKFEDREHDTIDEEAPRSTCHQ